MSSILRKFLKSISKSGSAKITGDATLSEGTNVTLTQSGNNIEIAATGAGGISNVVEDTTPQLGGDLDTQGYIITNSGGAVDVQGSDYNSARVIGGASADAVFQGGNGDGSFPDAGSVQMLAGTPSTNGDGGDILIQHTPGNGTGADGRIRLSNGSFEGRLDLSNLSANRTFTFPNSAGTFELEGHTHTASEVTDFDTEVSNNTDVAANTAARHAAVTVTDSAEIDFTLTGQDITASLKAGSIDETKLDTSTNASLDLADSATQPGDNISTLTNDSGYLSTVTAGDIDAEASADGYVLTSDGAGNAAWEAVAGSGTVTSVAQTVPTGFTVSGSPITSSGTLAVSYDTGYQGYTSAEATKLAGIETNADVTDTANVTAAGALMDSEVTDLAGIKALDTSTLVIGPASATDNAITRYDSTTGKLIQDSKASIDDNAKFTIGRGSPDNGSIEIVNSGGTSTTLSVSSPSGQLSIDKSISVTGDISVSGEVDGVDLANVVQGPASATDNAIARFDLTTGKLIQNSGVTIDDSDNISTVGDVKGNSLTVLGTVSGTTSMQSPGGGSLTLPSATDTLVGRATTDTLTNKTINASNNTISNINNGNWGGTDLSVANGGTGASTLTGLLQGNGTSAITGGATINNGNWSGTDLSVANGGTGVSTLTSGNVLVGAGTSAVTTTKAAPSGDFVGTSDSQTLTNKTLTTPTIAQINNSSAPGVKLQVRTQTDNSDSISSATTAGVFMQYGWGQKQGTGSALMTETVTFPTAFTTVLGVSLTWLGTKNTTAATDITDMTGAAPYNVGGSLTAFSISTTGFTAGLGRASGTFGSGTYYGYSWVAWGI